MNEDQISKFLFVFEGIGALFIGSFLIAYLLGLPTYNVYHSDPTFRLVLSIFGIFLVLLVIVALGFSTWVNKKK